MAEQIAVLVGSSSDWKKGIFDRPTGILIDMNIEWDVQILSAHRTPQATITYITMSPAKVFICCAGMAAHLAGVVAAHTIRPVLGVPLPGGMLDGLDALLSTVQMPPGVPVATFGVGEPGIKNAILFACSMLAMNNKDLRNKLFRYREEMAEKVLSHKIK